ncbi:hypothetical protein [Daejeonella lutea]|uniref:DUF4129 domain-containing protein n=1 Tax=Daejeonella lutea TaxID=572036 RepID=A0A1T5BCS0_9SPHI|nr:hypothetical protein [Daejeonella lutea]SKB45056.1 hypothetical protein SAMN05661099_1503 [Daejeonella lutea]
MQKFILVLFLLLALGTIPQSFSAVNVKKPNRIQLDSSLVVAKSFNQAALDKHRSDSDFQYGEKYQTALSWWDRFWKWFWNQFSSAVSDSTSSNLARNVSAIILAGLIIFLVIKFSGAGVLQLFTGKARVVPLAYAESLDNIHEIDFDPEIEKATQNRDYRLAVRMLYLKCLKKLSDAGFISWQIDKTNSAYISELVNHDRKQQFASLTRQFEFIWYGEFNIDQSVFTAIKQDFKDFNQGLS